MLKYKINLLIIDIKGYICYNKNDKNDVIWGKYDTIK